MHVRRAVAQIALVSIALCECGGRTGELGDSDALIGIGGGSDGGTAGGSGSGFPYSGPSCSESWITPACWSCLQSNCGGVTDCITNTCAAYYSCFCPCEPDDATCVDACQGQLEGACQGCSQGGGSCVDSRCGQVCSSGGSADGGSGDASTSGVQCTTAMAPCPNGQYLQSCNNGVDEGTCTVAYFQLGTQTFPCASCSDTAGCLQQVQAACQ